MVATDATKKFTVTEHALNAYRKRYPGGHPRHVLETEIFGHVMQGIEAGHVLRRKPDGFRLYREPRKDLPTGQRFIYRHPDSTVGFIVKRLPQEDVVITTLVRVGAL
jgi:hypothetical protein